MHSPSRSQSLRTLLRRRNLIALLLPLALLVFVNPPSSLSANSGDLDTTFGTGGRVFVDFSLESTANAVALQPDGKIIVAGDEGKDVRFNYDETTNFALARLNTDGSLDTTFGTGGRVSTDISFSDRAFDVALQSDGKIVAAGLANDYSGGGKTEFALARYNADGSLDTSFGTGGKVRTGFGFHSGAMGLVIQADQKLVAAGYISDSAGSNAVALVRYNTDGSLDTSFGTGGVVRSSTVGDVAYAIALQADQKIVVAGRPQAVVARYNTDGSLDTTFGSGGRAIRNTSPSGDMRAVAVQSDGKIVAAGDQGGGNYLLLRYNADGSPDTGFGLDGFLTTDFGGFDQAEAVAIQPDGRIVAAGSSTLSWTLARYQPDGLLDQNFGSGGRATTDMSSGTINSQRAKGIVIQPDGRIVAAGRAYNGTKAVFGVTRYNVDNTTPTPTPSPSPSPSPSPTPSPTPTPTPSPTPQPTPSPGPPGTLDPTFGTGGKSFVDFIPASGARALARAPGNKLYIAGYAGSTTGQTDFALAKLNTDGSLDTTFGSGGRVTTDINLGDAANAIAVQADGKIVAAGSTNETSGSTVDRQKINFALVRYNADGSLDTSFDGDGKVVTDLYGATDIAYGVAIQPDQKIVVAGYTSTEFAPDIAFFGLVRYNADGSLDNTFGTNGKVRTSFNNSGTAYAVTIQADGKIVVVGEGACDFAVARYNTDGSLDATFGTGGKVQTDLGKSFCDFAYAVAIQTDGKIVAAGTLTSKFFALVRYNTDGSLDTTFDGDGRVVTEFENREAVATGIVIQPDGKIIAAGSAGPGFEPPGQPASTVALARYNADGSLDTTFDGDGRVLTSMGDLTHGSGARGVILQSDGTIVVAGAGYNGTKFTFAVARYFATDPLPAPLTTLHFAQSSYTVAEGAGSLNITVIRSGDTFNPASVKYATSDPTDANFKCDPYTPGQATIFASRKCDYHIAVGTLRFAAGETTKQFTLSFTDDVYVEPAEAFSLSLSNPVGATLGENSTASVTITDNDTFGLPNPIDNTRFFVRQLYVDLLSREPDPAGWNGWTDRINLCGLPGQPPPPCDRVTVAGDGFLRSGEFFDRQFFVLRLYRTGLGRILRYEEIGDLALVSGFLTAEQLELNKQDLVNELVTRTEFASRYNGLNNTEFLLKLFETSGVTPPQAVQDEWIASLQNNSRSRAQVFREMSERPEVSAKYLHEAQVASAYYGFFTRNPDGAYLNYLQRLDSGEITLADLANAFINASEYRQRFGP